MTDVLQPSTTTMIKRHPGQDMAMAEYIAWFKHNSIYGKDDVFKNGTENVSL